MYAVYDVKCHKSISRKVPKLLLIEQRKVCNYTV